MLEGKGREGKGREEEVPEEEEGLEDELPERGRYPQSMALKVWELAQPSGVEPVVRYGSRFLPALTRGLLKIWSRFYDVPTTVSLGTYFSWIWEIESRLAFQSKIRMKNTWVVTFLAPYCFSQTLCRTVSGVLFPVSIYRRKRLSKANVLRDASLIQIVSRIRGSVQYKTTACAGHPPTA
jgi:hypothetical protein